MISLFSQFMINQFFLQLINRSVVDLGLITSNIWKLVGAVCIIGLDFTLKCTLAFQSLFRDVVLFFNDNAKQSSNIKLLNL